MREIGERFRISSPNGVMCHLKALEKKGLITRQPNMSRAIQLAAIDQEEPGLPVGWARGSRGHARGGRTSRSGSTLADLFPKKNHYVLEVHGDSMIEAQIADGDYVVVKKQRVAGTGPDGRGANGGWRGDAEVLVSREGADSPAAGQFRDGPNLCRRGPGLGHCRGRRPQNAIGPVSRSEEWPGAEAEREASDGVSAEISYSSILRYSVARPMPNSRAASGTRPRVRRRASSISFFSQSAIRNESSCSGTSTERIPRSPARIVIACSQDDGTVDDVPQLANVPRPTVVQQTLPRAVVNPQLGASVEPAKVVEEIVQQQFQIRATITQWWNLQLEDSQPVVEILAKTPLPDKLLQISVRGRDHADIDRRSRRPPPPAERVCLPGSARVSLGLRAAIRRFRPSNSVPLSAC